MWDAEAAEKGGYEHFMMKEIHEQPKAVADTLNSVVKTGEIDLSEVGLTDADIAKISQIYIVACGSAYHVGMAAQYVMGNSSLWKKLNGDTSAVKGNIMVASLPNKNQFVRSYALAINSNSKNQEAAIRFLDFMNGKEQQRRLSRDTSLIPIIRELYDDEMILDANPHVKGIKQSVQNSSSFATVSINGENLKKLEEALIKFFNNEETSMNTGKIFEDLMQ